MRHDFLRLRPLLRRSVYAVFAILFASGAAWWISQPWLRSAAGDGSAPSALEPWLLKIHGAAAMAALAILGILYPLHLVRGWRARRNRGWGSGLVAVCATLILTGYLLYYAGGENLRSAASAIHLWLGLIFPVILIVHIWRGRKTRSLEKSASR